MMSPMNDTNKIRPGKQSDESRKIFQAVCFSLDGNEYGIDISRVTEIIRPVNVRVASGLPPFIMGFISYDDREVPLMNLRKRMGMEAIEIDNKGRIMVAEDAGKMIGLAVDAVTEVIRMDPTQISNVPYEGKPSGENLLMAVYRDDDKQVRILDGARIFDF